MDDFKNPPGWNGKEGTTCITEDQKRFSLIATTRSSDFMLLVDRSRQHTHLLFSFSFTPARPNRTVGNDTGKKDTFLNFSILQ